MTTAIAGETITRTYHTARPGLSDEDATIIGPILELLAAQGKGRPQDIVEAATPDDSPLHHYFQWDDGRAATLYRIQQARWLARSFRIEITEVGHPQRTTFTVPGLASIRFTDGGRRYETIEQVRADGEKIEQICADAAARLAYWRRIFSAYRNIAGFERFEPVFQALEAIEVTSAVN